MRMLRLVVPASIERIQAESCPVLLEAIEVEQGNLHYRSQNGVLFSKDMKTLVRYPGYKSESCYEVPECVEKIQNGAFENAYLKKIILPVSVRSLEKGAFVNAVIEELVFADGYEEIADGIFINCRIKKIVFPKTFKVLKSHAFEGTTGIEEIECISDEVKLGVGAFCNGEYKNVEWWPWEVIPKAAFLNSSIDEISIPEGVRYIDDYAFAGCYKAKQIRIAKSVEHIGLHSFDEGFSYSGNVFMPADLYHFCYRFPVLSQINRKEKNVIWAERTKKDFEEETYILQQQMQDIDACEKRLNVLQIPQKKALQKERAGIVSILEQGEQNGKLSE